MAFDPYAHEKAIRQEMEYMRRKYEEELRYREQQMRMQTVWYDPMVMYQPGGITAAKAAPSSKPLEKKRLDALAQAKPRTVGAKVPDSITPIVAWRAWRTIEQNGQWRLKALGKETIWEPKKQISATCSAGTQHPAPHKSCECGIWCFSSMEELVKAANGYSSLTVIGTVSIWGRVIECANGFRAQYAYPAELWLLDSSMEELGYIYGVPVRTV